ncbi:hypothetical protein Tco_0578608 [Tanacetum coccineum]
MHNNIMAAGSKERPPMLGPGRYSQWHSRFLRYLDTKSNGEYLRKCIFDGPYMPTNVLIAAVEAAENILPVAAHEEVETIHNMTAENKLYVSKAKKSPNQLLSNLSPFLRKNKTEDTTPRYNKDNQSGQFGNQRTMTVAGARETVGSLVVQTKWEYSALTARIWTLCQVRDTDEEIYKQKLEAHSSYMAKIQEVSPDESSSTDTPLEQECKTNLDESSRALGEATSSRDSSLIALQTKQTELEKYTALNDLTIVKSEYKRELAKKSLLTSHNLKVNSKRKLSQFNHSHVTTEMRHSIMVGSTFDNPKVPQDKLKSDNPHWFVEIPLNTSDPANRFCPDGEDTVNY